MTEYRIEEDTLGPVKIPAEALWGPQTERSRNNFPTGELMPIVIIRAMLNIKKAAAESNLELKNIDQPLVMMSYGQISRCTFTRQVRERKQT